MPSMSVSSDATTRFSTSFCAPSLFGQSASSSSIKMIAGCLVNITHTHTPLKTYQRLIMTFSLHVFVLPLCSFSKYLTQFCLSFSIKPKKKNRYKHDHTPETKLCTGQTSLYVLAHYFRAVDDRNVCSNLIGYRSPNHGLPCAGWAIQQHTSRGLNS